MKDMITVAGMVATRPRHLVFNDKSKVTSFRLSSYQGKVDPVDGEAVSGDMNWYTVTVFGHMAVNAAESLTPGDQVIVFGSFSIKSWETADGSGSNVAIEAVALGHNLFGGTSVFTRETRPQYRTSWLKAIPVEEPTA